MTAATPRALSARASWWATFALLTLAGATWALATPLLSGADESDHAIRAAAVVRGQPIGGETSSLLGSSNVFIEVEVPAPYAGAREAAACFVALPDDAEPTPFAALGPPPPCVDLPDDPGTVRAVTLQYRGQPTYYAVVGLVTLLWPGALGIVAMRIVSAALTAALLASALASARGTGSRLLVLAVLAGATPVSLWLSGQVNTGGFEIAAAVLVWTAGIVVARAPRVLSTDVACLGVGLIALALVRGLSPAFAAGAIVVLALLAGRDRRRDLVARPDVRRWAVGVAVAWLAAMAWLALIQVRYPLDPRPGTGLAHALGLWWWYLRQTVGVFGVNDITLPWLGVLAWGAVVVGVIALGLRRASWSDRGLVALVAVGAYVTNFTAEGLSFPPIGYFWQGRYVLPLLVGVVVVAAGADLGRRPDAAVAPAADDPDPASAPTSPLATRAIGAAAGVLVVVHAWSFAEVGRHMAGAGTRLGFADAWRDPAWTPPLLPPWAWLAIHAAALAGVVAVAMAPGSDERDGDAARARSTVDDLDPRRTPEPR